MADYLGSSGMLFSEKVTIDPSTVTAGNVSRETFAVTGLKKGRVTHVEMPSIETGLFLIGWYCATNGVLTLDLFNPTGSDINPASQVIYVQQS